MKKAHVHISRWVILCLLFSSLALFGSTGEASSTIPGEVDNGTAPFGVLSPKGPLATGGPDEYGYTWDDSVASSWMEISATGTDAGLSDLCYDKATGSIPLGFSFDYYENAYDSVNIACSGYISFSDNEDWPWFIEVPGESFPNNVIAPFATPLRLASSGPAKRIYYQGGGTAPDRYFVVEWYQVTNIMNTATLTFQVILHENGDIVFNYPTTTTAYFSAAAGIEDSSGLDGLGYLYLYSVPFITVPSVRFYRPEDSARVDIVPPVTSQFSQAGKLVEFPITIRNLGELGVDTYDLTSVSIWPVSFFDVDGATLLTDTDGDEVIDTGSIPQGENKTVIVKMQTPAPASVGVDNCGVVTATSSLNSGKTDTTELCATIPAPFAGVFMDTDDGAVNLDLVKTTDQNLLKITGEDVNGEGSAIVETDSGYAIVWSQPSDDGTRVIRELYYLLTDQDGTALGPAQKLIDNSSAFYDTFDEMPAIDVAPDGNIGILWKHTQANAVGEYLVNINFAEVDSEGDLVFGPTDLTGNTLYGNNYDPGYLVFDHPVVFSTPDGHFIFAWEHIVFQEGNSWTGSIYLSVRDNAGVELKTPTKISTGYSRDPALGLYLNGTDYIMVAYANYFNDIRIVYSIYDTFGEIVDESYVQIPLDSAPDDVGERPDIVNLSTGGVLIAFSTFDGRIGYAINGSPGCSVNILDNPDAATNDAIVSVAADQDGHGVIIASYYNAQPTFDIPILTDNKSPGRRLYYALIDSNCSVITPLRPFYASAGTGSIIANEVGYSATSRFVPPEGVDLKIDAPGEMTVPLGEDVTFTIEYGNDGQTTATGVTIVATTGATYISDTSGITPEFSDYTITWHLPDQPYQAAGQFDLTLRFTDPPILEEIYNIVEIDCSEDEINLYDNLRYFLITFARLNFLSLIMK